MESVVAELEEGTGSATWKTAGHYFAENGIHNLQDIAKWVYKQANRQNYLNLGSATGTGSDKEL